jgi:hypothetical protein
MAGLTAPPVDVGGSLRDRRVSPLSPRELWRLYRDGPCVTPVFNLLHQNLAPVEWKTRTGEKHQTSPRTELGRFWDRVINAFVKDVMQHMFVIGYVVVAFRDTVHPVLGKLVVPEVVNPDLYDLEVLDYRVPHPRRGVLVGHRVRFRDKRTLDDHTHAKLGPPELLYTMDSTPHQQSPVSSVRQLIFHVLVLQQISITGQIRNLGLGLVMVPENMATLGNLLTANPTAGVFVPPPAPPAGGDGFPPPGNPILLSALGRGNATTTRAFEDVLYTERKEAMREQAMTAHLEDSIYHTPVPPAMPLLPAEWHAALGTARAPVNIEHMPYQGRLVPQPASVMMDTQKTILDLMRTIIATLGASAEYLGLGNFTQANQELVQQSQNKLYQTVSDYCGGINGILEIVCEYLFPHAVAIVAPRQERSQVLQILPYLRPAAANQLLASVTGLPEDAIDVERVLTDARAEVEENGDSVKPPAKKRRVQSEAQLRGHE